MTAAPASVRDACPRCSRPLLRNHDVLECLNCGSIEEPGRPWDIPSNDTDLEGRKRRRTVDFNPLPWTEGELTTWQTWREGDPLPDDQGGRRGMTETGDRASRLLPEAEDEVRQCNLALTRLRAKMRELQAEYERRSSEIRGRRRRWQRVILALRTGPLPAFECQDCGGRFQTSQALGGHRTYKHPEGHAE